jgi:hypothetical protein
VFKTRAFARWSRKSGLPDRTLCAAVIEISAGLVEADLGGNAIKKNEREAIDARELAVLKLTAAALLEMDPSLLVKALHAGELTEICHEEESDPG